MRNKRMSLDEHVAKQTSVVRCKQCGCVYMERIGKNERSGGKVLFSCTDCGAYEVKRQ